MSSGSPSQTVHDVGGPSRRKPEEPVDGHAGELPLQVVERRVERGARRVLARRQRGAAISSSAHGSSSSGTASSQASAEATDSSYRPIGAPSPKPDTPPCRTSTSTSSTSSCDSREITNVSASGSVTARAASSTGATLTLLRRP